jgi:hypothetical protein
LPQSAGVVPRGMGDLVVQFHILLQMVLINYIAKILPNLRGVRVKVCPVGIPGPSELEVFILGH